MKGIILADDGRKIPHGWKRRTMGRCAEVHLEQLMDRHFNMPSGKEKEKEIGRIAYSYLKIRRDVYS